MRRWGAVCLVALALAACGRRAEPAPPGPAGAVIYPKQFPPATGP